MSPTDPTVDLLPLEPSRYPAAVSLLADALHDDPTIRWCFLDDRPVSYEERLRAYLDAVHEWHVDLGQPTLAALDGDKLVGVLYVMEPEIEVTEDSLAPLHQRVLTECGPDSTDRLFRYHLEMDELCPPGPAHILAFVAVRMSRRRQGIGAAMVSWLNEQCDAHPTSIGIGLDTAHDDALAFFQTLGFDVVGEREFDGLTQQALFRPKVS